MLNWGALGKHAICSEHVERCNENMTTRDNCKNTKHSTYAFYAFASNAEPKQ